MSATLYLGVPGSGKSYGVVKHCIVPALKRGRRVVSNIPLNIEKLSEHIGTDVSQQVVLFDEVDFSASNFWFTQSDKGETFTKHGDLIVIDEASDYFIEFSKRHPLYEGIRKHRHYADEAGNSVDIVFISQVYSDLPKQLSAVCKVMFVINNLEAVGDAGRYSVHKYAKAGQPPDRQQPLGVEFGSFDLEYFELYSSRSHAKEAGSVFEFNSNNIDQRLNIWNSPVSFLYFNIPFLTLKRATILAVIFVVLCIIFAIRSFTGMSDITAVSESSKSTKSAASASASSAPSTAPALPANATAPKPVASSIQSGESTQFRLVGFYQFNSIPVAVVSDSDGKYRYLVNSFERVYAGPASHIKYNGEIIASWTGSPNRIKSSNSSTSNIFGALSK